MSARARECTRAGPVTHDRIPAPRALLDQQPCHDRILDRLLARHIARHEFELTGGIGREEGGRVDVNPFTSVFRGPDRNALARLHSPPFPHPEHVGAVQDECRVHARLPRQTPTAGDADVGRQVGRREEAVRQHAISGCRNEGGVRGAGEARGREVRRREGCHTAKNGGRLRGAPRDHDPTRAGARATQGRGSAGRSIARDASAGRRARL